MFFCSLCQCRVPVATEAGGTCELDRPGLWMFDCQYLGMHALHLTASCCAQVKIGNSAIGGITSSTAAQCFDAMVDPESDVVLIEFSLNDR